MSRVHRSSRLALLLLLMPLALAGRFPFGRPGACHGKRRDRPQTFRLEALLGMSQPGDAERRVESRPRRQQPVSCREQGRLRKDPAAAQSRGDAPEGIASAARRGGEVGHGLDRRGVQQDRRAPRPSVRVLARRLNNFEYNNTVRDLLGLRTQPAREFPPDDSALGFDNIADALSISPALMEKYLATAERVAREAVLGSPVRKNHVEIFTPPVPRRMELTNRLRVEPAAYYSMQDYDATGLSQPGSLHLSHYFPGYW